MGGKPRRKMLEMWPLEAAPSHGWSAHLTPLLIGAEKTE